MLITLYKCEVSCVEVLMVMVDMLLLLYTNEKLLELIRFINQIII